MPQSLSNILVHLIFSTKNREPLINDNIAAELHPYLAALFRVRESPALTINGTEDHIHALFALSRTQTVAGIVEEVKTQSSKWIKIKGPLFYNFHWQTGYGAFSIGRSSEQSLRKYIAEQKQHHRKKTFQDEYRTFLRKYGVEYDERYVWD